MPKTDASSDAQLPYHVFADEFGSCGDVRLPLNTLSGAQRDKVEAFSAAVARATGALDVDHPRIEQTELGKLLELAARCSEGDDAVKAHVDHVLWFQVYPCVMRVTVAEFEAATALREGSPQDLSQAPEPVQALARLLCRAAAMASRP